MAVIRRIIDSLFAVWAVLTAVFFVTHKLGDPAVLLLPIGASAADIASLREQMGLDLPLLAQYQRFISGILHGHIGESFIFSRSAMQVVLDRLPATLELGLCALFLAAIFGLIAGCILATQHGMVASAARIIVAVGQSIPVFVIGLGLVILFALEMQWLPVGGRGGWRHLILPALSLAIFLGAQLAKVTEASITQVLHEPYVTMARVKGLTRITVFTWYVLRNALVPVLTLLGILAGELVGGAVVVETVFAWPGVGRLIFQAIQNGDIPLVSAAVLLTAIAVIFSNLLIDLTYLALDPRTRRSHS